MPWMETGAGSMELLTGLDNRQWLPAYIEDSWDPDDDMRLMKSAFGHRFMINDRWGRSLLLSEAPMGEQEGAAGDEASGLEEAQEVQLEEYQGWSQGMRTPDGKGEQGVLMPRGRGSRTGGLGRTAGRRPSPPRERTSSAQGQKGTRGSQQGRGGHPAPVRVPHSPPSVQGRPNRCGHWWTSGGAVLDHAVYYLQNFIHFYGDVEDQEITLRLC
jgi:hypothetical protein